MHLDSPFRVNPPAPLPIDSEAPMWLDIVSSPQQVVGESRDEGPLVPLERLHLDVLHFEIGGIHWSNRLAENLGAFDGEPILVKQFFQLAAGAPLRQCRNLLEQANGIGGRNRGLFQRGGKAGTLSPAGDALDNRLLLAVFTLRDPLRTMNG